MRALWDPFGKRLGLGGLGICLALSGMTLPCAALDKPTGAPLVISPIETEQPIPLAVVSPDGKTVSCIMMRVHWSPKADIGPNDDPTAFTIDLPSTSPSASIFTAQLWNASLSSSLAWQQPWQGARWKMLDVPETDGSGIDAALAVGMIATSARRPYPKDTLVIGSLNPDGSFGPVSRLGDRLSAAAAAGVTRVIIPSVQRFDTSASGDVVNMVKHASDLNLTCIPVDNLVEATETVMNDPLPDPVVSSTTPKYSNDVATYIDDFVQREQSELTSALQYAPKETDLGNLPSRVAATWKTVYSDHESGSQAYSAGQVYIAYKLFAHANSLVRGVDIVAGQNKDGFDVKSVLAESDSLRLQVHQLMNPPSIDKGELESALLVAEMADWAYDINALLEGAQVVTKQAFSLRSDATDAEKDRARETMLFAIEQSKYLLNEGSFYQGLVAHIGANNPMPVDDNATHLLPELIPAQLATAQLFTDGIRRKAEDLRDGLLFDPKLVAYVGALRELKMNWDATQKKKEMDATDTAANAPKPDASPVSTVGFDPGGTYAPPHTVLVPTDSTLKVSNVALCLIWVNNDCEIASLDEKYLRLSGTIDPATHEWHMQDRAKLDALLQSADLGARQGIAFAEKTEVDTSVLGMIYEVATNERSHGDDAMALNALRNYWRCALLGNMCWQLAHTHKAEAVDLSKDSSNAKSGKSEDQAKTADAQAKSGTAKSETTITDHPTDQAAAAPATTTNSVSNAAQPPEVTAENHDTPAPPRALPVEQDPPPPRALPADNGNSTNAAPAPPAPAPEPTTAGDNANVPVAPVAKTEDYTGGDSSTSTPATTNAAPANPTATKP